MSDLKAVLEIIDAVGTPITAVIAWLVWRIYSNHLPHIVEKLDDYNTRISTIEGHQQIRLRREGNGKRQSKR